MQLFRTRGSLGACVCWRSVLSPRTCNPQLFCRCSVVRQAFGVMRMTERRWEAAYDELYAAFKSYQVRWLWSAVVCVTAL